MYSKVRLGKYLRQFIEFITKTYDDDDEISASGKIENQIYFQIIQITETQTTWNPLESYCTKEKVLISEYFI